MLAQTHAASLRLGAYARPGGIPGFPNMVALPYQQQVQIPTLLNKHGLSTISSMQQLHSPSSNALLVSQLPYLTVGFVECLVGLMRGNE